ncbi:MAG: helix-turn-helix domain-containing protein [Patescibacteria group bacterium]|jgi:excisionase family DNA binding protein
MKNINNQNQNFLTVKQLADILGISRIAVFNKIKKEQLMATKAGKTYLIPKDQLTGIIDNNLSEEEKVKIKKGVSKVIRDYGETLKMLGKE